MRSRIRAFTTCVPPPPGFFVSVASKGFRNYVSGLESTLANISTSVDSKELTIGLELCKTDEELKPEQKKRQ